MRVLRLVVAVAIAAAAGMVVSSAQAADSRVVFRGDRGGQPGLYVLSAQGVVSLLISDAALGCQGQQPCLLDEPVWSPDGAFVAATYSQGADNQGLNSQIAIVDVSTRQIVSSFDAAGRARNPDWSPDGAEIVFVENDGLHLYNVAGGQVTRFPGAQGSPQLTNAIAPAFSPDGARVAFVFDPGDHQQSHPPLDVVVVSRADGSELTRRSGVGFVEDLAWSPDGTRLVANSAGNACIAAVFTFASDGSGGISTVHEDGCFYLGVDWTASNRIVFGLEPGGAHHDLAPALYAINPDGSGLVQITQPGDGQDASPSVFGASVPIEGQSTSPPPATPAPTAPPAGGTSSAGTASQSSVLPGGQVTISGSGFAAGATLAITFHSTPVSLGTTQASAQGTYAVTVTIPATATPGPHRIVVSGPGAAGGTHESVTHLTVTVPPLPDTGSDGVAVAALSVLMLAAGLSVRQLASARTRP